VLQWRDRGGAPPAGTATAGINVLHLAARPRGRGRQPAPAEQLVRRATAPTHPKLELPARAEIQVDVLFLHE